MHLFEAGENIVRGEGDEEEEEPALYSVSSVSKTTGYSTYQCRQARHQGWQDECVYGEGAQAHGQD
jgi:hypothetical protein